MLVRTLVNVHVVVPVALGIRVSRPTVLVQIFQEYVTGLLLALVRAPIVAVGLVHRCLFVALLNVAGGVMRSHVVVMMMVAEGAGDSRDRW